ncbi:MAG: penicillin-binding protein [Eubacterium sp.]|nr:penicillin-binding protein [Eubacterium sp.]
MENDKRKIEEIRSEAEQTVSKPGKKAKLLKKRSGKSAERKKTDRPSKQGRPKKPGRAKRIILTVVLALAGVILASGIVIYANLKPLYRDAKEQSYEILSTMNEGTFKMESATRIYDKEGSMIGRIGYANYEYVPVADVSAYVTDGYIAVEDQNFKQHSGVDYKATLRAAIQLVLNRGEITQGGSTITMQVLKNNVLTQERKFTRKILEMVLAREVEKQYNKAQIMEFYVNSCYYGNQCYGIQSAAKYYFKKDAKDLTLGEAAMLVGTSNRPNALNPAADYDACLEKRDQVLGRMETAGYITEAERTAAAEEQPEIFEYKEKVDNEDAMTTYAIHCAALKLMEAEGFAFQYTFDDDASYDAYVKSYESAYQDMADRIRDGGYQIETSLDQEIQKRFQNAVDTTLAEETEREEDGRYALQAAGICIDNETGLTVAVIGGRGDAGEYNRAYQAKRQAGSAIKPLLDYGPAINEGMISAGTLINDSKIDFSGYQPRNYNDIYRGNITAREAMARSSNSVAVQVLEETGMRDALEYLGRMKFRTLSYADNHNLSAGLGSLTNGVTVEDMARGFATIANGGKMRDSGCIRTIRSDLEGEVYRYEGEETEIFNQDTAFILTDMMQGVCREDYGTAAEYVSDQQYYAGKTGTTNDNQDIWFGGYSPYYTAVTWVGYDLPRESETLADEKYNIRIWSAFMDGLHTGLEKKDYAIPDTVLLDNGSGKYTKPDYTEDVYDSRPGGSDYVSGMLLDKIAEEAYRQRLEEQQEAAEEAVKAFEDFQITSAEDADRLEEEYNYALGVVEEMEDEEARRPFMERLARKYELLAGEVETKWLAVKAAEEAEAQDAAYLQNQENAMQSVETADARIHDANVRTVQNYIDALNRRTVYTNTIQDIIDSARSALARCEEYSEYSSLQAELNQAVSHVGSLPTAEELQRQAEEAERLEEASTQTEEDPVIETTVTP